jgi:hypothetical protein
MENQMKFYEWMLKMNNIHLADNKKMAKAYEAIVKNDAQLGKLVSK